MNTTSNANTDPMLVPLFLLLLTSSPTFDNSFQCCILRSPDRDWDQRQGGPLAWIVVDWIVVPHYRYKSQQYTSRLASSTQALCTVYRWWRYTGNGKEQHVGRSSVVRDAFIVCILSLTSCFVGILIVTKQYLTIIQSNLSGLQDSPSDWSGAWSW